MHENHVFFGMPTLLFVPWEKVLLQEVHETLAVILTPSETLNGPTSSLPMIAA